MMRYLKLLLLAPIALVLVLLALANRQIVTFVFDPFSRGTDAASITLPLFVLAFVVLCIGIVLGYSAAWLAQGKHRRAARSYKRECEKLVAERSELRAALPVTAPALLSQK